MAFQRTGLNKNPIPTQLHQQTTQKIGAEIAPSLPKVPTTLQSGLQALKNPPASGLRLDQNTFSKAPQTLSPKSLHHLLGNVGKAAKALSQHLQTQDAPKAQTASTTPQKGDAIRNLLQGTGKLGDALGQIFGNKEGIQGALDKLISPQGKLSESLGKLLGSNGSMSDLLGRFGDQMGDLLKGTRTAVPKARSGVVSRAAEGDTGSNGTVGDNAGNRAPAPNAPAPNTRSPLPSFELNTLPRTQNPSLPQTPSLPSSFLTTDPYRGSSSSGTPQGNFDNGLPTQTTMMPLSSGGPKGGVVLDSAQDNTGSSGTVGDAAEGRNEQPAPSPRPDGFLVVGPTPSPHMPTPTETPRPTGETKPPSITTPPQNNSTGNTTAPQPAPSTTTTLPPQQPPVLLPPTPTAPTPTAPTPTVQQPAPTTVQQPAPTAVQQPAPTTVQQPAPTTVQAPAPQTVTPEAQADRIREAGTPPPPLAKLVSNNPLDEKPFDLEQLEKIFSEGTPQQKLATLSLLVGALTTFAPELGLANEMLDSPRKYMS